jgi:hypothetical protein
MIELDYPQTYTTIELHNVRSTCLGVSASSKVSLLPFCPAVDLIDWVHDVQFDLHNMKACHQTKCQALLGAMMGILGGSIHRPSY